MAAGSALVRIRLGGIALGLAFLVACNTGPAARSPESRSPGQLRILLSAEGSPGIDVTFRLGALVAESENGSHQVLFAGSSDTYSTSDLARSPASLPASPLAAGLYRGLGLRFVDAVRADGAARTPLRTPADTVWVRGSFRVLPGAEATVSLSLDLKQSFPSAGEFSPSINVRASQKRPRRSLLLLSLEGVPQVLALDRTDGERIAAVVLSAPPGGLTLSPDIQRAFVAEPDQDSIAQVDLLSFSVLDRARVHYGSRPRDVVAPAPGKFVFVVCEDSNELLVIDARSLGRVTSLDSGQRPIRVEADPFGERVYVISPLGREVRVFDARNPRLLARVAVDPEPTALAFSRDGSRYLVAHQLSEAVLAFDRRTDAPVGRAVVGPGSVDIVSDPTSNRLYVLQRNPPRLLYLDPLSLGITRSVPLPSVPRRAAVDPDSASLFVTLADRPEILVVDRASGRIQGSFPINGIGTKILIVP